MRSSPRAGVDLALSAWRLRQHDNFYVTRPSTGERTRNALVLSERRGASGSVAWRGGGHALVAGADAVAWDFRHEFEPYDAIARYTYALFVNDTVAAGRLSFIPGLRYDHSTLSGGVVSPSLGATWLASPDVLFRASASRGFHDPSIVKYFDAPPVGYYASGGIGAERIWSYQAGLEANAGDLVRFRLTVFRHDVDDVLVPKQLGPGASTTVNAGRGRTTGGELEAATRPLAGFVLKAGVHHERIRQFDFGDALSAPARDVTGASAAVAYEGRGGLRGILQARYLNWDVTERWRAGDGGVVVDASLAHELLAARGLRIEVFGAARNLLDAASYGDVTQRNPGRWVEAGARCAF